MLLLERGGFDGMAMEEVEARLYRGEQLASGGQNLSIRGLVSRKNQIR